MEEILEKIKVFADKAHGDQTRKYTPEPYIEHPIRVMETCRKYENRIEVLAAALLHDVVEDTQFDNQQVVEFLQTLLPMDTSLKVGKLVEELTDVYIKEDYPFLNRKERKLLEADRLQKVSKDAQTIKYADIIDNSQYIVSYDAEFGRKYLNELKRVLELADQGNPGLYQLANQIVDSAIAELSRSK